MTLNSKTKNLIGIGSILKDSGNEYKVINKDIQGNGRHIYITTRTSAGQTLYYMPISFYYGTTIIK